MPSEGAHGDAFDHAHGSVGGQVGPDEEGQRKAGEVVRRATARACLPEKSAIAAPTSGSTVSSVGNPVDSVHGRLLQIRIAASATTAKARMLQVGLHAAILHARQQAAAG